MGRWNDLGHTELEESPCSPIRCPEDSTAMPRDQNSSQHKPLLEVRSSAHRSEELRWYVCGGKGP